MLNAMLVGIGGYGENYVKALETLEMEGRAKFCAVVDPFAGRSADWPRLAERGMPCFDSLSEALTAGIEPELIAICSPIAFHAAQSCAALEAGAHVLCEKPISATTEEACRMIRARDAAGRFLAIGYQWSFSAAIQRLKADVLAGRLGAPRELRSWVCWPRGSAYYGRNNWAGRIRDDHGQLVYDSPVSNATAHYLHNMLYVIGPAVDRSARPVRMWAECYRANDIENFDAAGCRIATDNGAEIIFLSAHCVKNGYPPHFKYRFDDATVIYAGEGDILCEYADGRVVSYGDPFADQMRKLRDCIEWAESGRVDAVVCGPEAASMHTLCVEGLQQVPVTQLDPADLRREALGTRDDVLTYLPGLDSAMRRGYESGRLFSELREPWARAASEIKL